MSYAVFSVALNRARERAAAESSDDAFLTELLEMSAGKRLTDGGKEYRPFYVAARYLRQSRRDQSISAAEDGVKFTNQVAPIADLLELQAALDQALSVPTAFLAIAAETPPQPSAAALKSTYEAALMSLKKYSPRP